MALDDPTKKMSKSDASPNGVVFLLDSPDDIRAKITQATTDSLKEIRFDEKRPGIYNLLAIYELFSGLSRKEIEKKFAGKGYAEFKKDLAEVIIKGLKPLQKRFKELTADPAYIDSLLSEAAVKLRPRAEKKLKEIKDKIGLG